MFKKLAVLFLFLIIANFASINSSATALQTEESEIRVVPISEVNKNNMDNIDAIIVEKQTELSENSEWLKQAAQQSIVVYTGSLTDLVQRLNFDKPMPTMKTESTEYVVSFYYQRNGRDFLGGLLEPLENPQDNEVKIAEFVSVVQANVDQIAGPNPRPPIPPDDYIIFLPLLGAKGSDGDGEVEWDPLQVLIHQVLNCPMGQYVDVAEGQQVLNDGSQNYDFYGLKLQQQMLPGIQVCTGSPYFSDEVDTESWPNAKLYKYGPTSSSGLSEVPVDISVLSGDLGGTVDAIWSWVFSGEDAEIRDNSSFVRGDASWEIVLSGNASRFTYTSEPGLSYRTFDGHTGGPPAVGRSLTLIWTNRHVREVYRDYWWVEWEVQ